MVYDVNKDKEEKVYGVPYATNASGVIYNVDKFKEHGIEIPKTWDEFIDVLEKLQDAGEQPLLMTYKDAWTSNCPWNSIASDLAPESFNDDRKAGKTTFVGTHEEIAEKYMKLLDYAQDDFMGLTYDDGNKAFANGEAAMIINGNWAINQYKMQMQISMWICLHSRLPMRIPELCNLWCRCTSWCMQRQCK